MYLLRHVPWHNFIHEDRGGTPVLSFFGWYSAQTNRKLTKKKNIEKKLQAEGAMLNAKQKNTLPKGTVLFSRGHSALFQNDLLLELIMLTEQVHIFISLQFLEGYGPCLLKLL